VTGTTTPYGFNVKSGIHITDVGRFIFNWDAGEPISESGRHDIGLDSSLPLVSSMA
jgi:hypothetical protein